MANITGKYNLANFGIYPYCKAEFHLSAVDTDADAAYIPDAVSVVIGSDGSIDAELWENDNGSRGTVYTNHVVVYADSSYQREVKRIGMGKIAVVGDAEIQDLLVTNVVPSTQENALALAQAAAAVAVVAAEAAEDARDEAEAARDAAALFDPDNFQPKDATLTSIAALGTAAGRMLYSTAPDTWAEAVITAAGRALLDDADAAAQRATLGLGAVTATTSPVADLNAITVSGWASFALGAANAPMADNSGYVLTITSGTVGVQMVWGHLGSADDTFSWMRWRGSSSWRPWVKLRTLNASGDAPTYACRAWVNFNGTGTVAIRAAGNVSSITDNGVGDYRVNFTTAMQDANYAAVADIGKTASVGEWGQTGVSGKTTSTLRVNTSSGNSSLTDFEQVCVTVFR